MEERFIIPYSHCSTQEEAYNIVQQKIPELLSQWKIVADVSYQSGSPQVSAKGKGFSMDITFENNQAVADVSLSFPLSTLKNTILSPLKKEFTKYL